MVLTKIKFILIYLHHPLNKEEASGQILNNFPRLFNDKNIFSLYGGGEKNEILLSNIDYYLC